MSSPLDSIKLNINGELVELKDLDKVVKALTKKQRDEISKLKEDIISIDKLKITAKKFEIIGNESMRKSLNSLISCTIESDSVFTKMLALPVGMQASEFITYLDIKIQPGVNSETPIIYAQPIQVATPEKWQSKSFTSRVSSVTEESNNSNTNCFKAITFKLLTQDNSISTVQGFNSTKLNIVGNGSGTFNVGRFFVNNKPIDLISGDSLDTIVNKINNAKLGVKASVVDTLATPQFKLNLQSDKIGAEHSILIDDPNGVFTKMNNSSGKYFIQDPQYETFTLEIGDKLNEIVEEIQECKSSTSTVSSMTEESNNSNTNSFRAITVKVLIRDNSVKDPQYETFTLEIGDTLNEIVEKIKRCKSLTSTVSSMTEESNNSNTNCFRAGTVKLLTQDNSISTVQGFNSTKLNIVGNGSGTFNVGRFFVNNKPIDLISGDSLDTIVNKINNAKLGVKASVVDTLATPQFKLNLQSDKIGAEHSILIDDPNGVFTKMNNSSGKYFIQDPQYETLTLEIGDTLNDIAYKINKFEKTTNFRADVFQIGRGQYTLVLKSLATGVENAFTIIDKDNSNANIILNGSNSGKVFGDVFNSTVLVTNGSKASVLNANDAKLIIDGTEIQSPVNSFSIYNGIDVIVKSPHTHQMSFEIKHDINSIFIGINNIVDKYNLFRQMYLDTNKSNKKFDQSEFEKNSMISSAMQNMSAAFKSLEDLDIGLSEGLLELETEDCDKTIKKEYQKMIILDKHKLIENLTNNPEKVRKAFDISFDSSSSNCIPPIVNRKISINNRPLGAKKIDLDLSIDTSKLKVRSKSSVVFTDPSNIVDQSGSDKTKLKPGVFWINGSPITIKSAMSITEVVSVINQSSNMSRITAVNNGNYISLSQYSGNFPVSDDNLKFKRMNIYDPKNILQDAFSSIMETGIFAQSILKNTGTFTVNGVTINGQNSVDNLVNAINNVSLQTCVTATKVSTGGNNYYIQFTTNKLQDIIIDNSGLGLNGIKLPTVKTPQSNNYFFDTSTALTSSVKINGKEYSNPMILTINGADIKSGGSITVLNIENTAIKIDNLEILFIGGQSDSAKISISEGLAANLISQLDEIFKLKQGYKGSTSGILQVNNAIDQKRSELEKNIKVQEERLTINEKALLKKFSMAQSKTYEGQAYIDMIKDMMKTND